MFGRDATQALALEGPQLPSTTPVGDVFLRSLHGRIRDVHEAIYNRSQEIRKLRHERRNARRLKTQKPQRPIMVGDYVYLLWRDWERAAYVRKHGKGQPWKHRYLVVDVSREYGIKLEVKDKRGIMEWQPRRRVSHAPFEPHVGGETFDRPDDIGAYRLTPNDEVPQGDEEGDLPQPTLLRIVDARYEGAGNLVIQVEWRSAVEDRTYVSDTDYDVAHDSCTTDEARSHLAQAVELARLRAGMPDESDGQDEIDGEEIVQPEEGQTFHLGWMCLGKETRQRAWNTTCEYMSGYYHDMIAAMQFLGRGAD